MFCVALSLTFNCEVVVFSPARRASRKILERMHEFVTLLGYEHRICEYNQENLRLRSLEGKLSLIRSFPSKVAVCAISHSHACTHTTHTYALLHTHTVYHPYRQSPSRSGSSRLEYMRCARYALARPFARTRLPHLMSAIPLRAQRHHYGHPSPVREQSNGKTFRLDMGKFSDAQKGPALVPSIEKSNRGSSRSVLPITQTQPSAQSAQSHSTDIFPEKRMSLMGFPLAIVVAASCCCIASVVFTMSIFLMTKEMSITRQQVMPLINAAVPIMEDGTQLSNLAIGTSEKVLNIAEITKNATSNIDPILSNVVEFMNKSAALMTHMEHFSRHPSLHIDLGNADDSRESH